MSAAQERQRMFADPKIPVRMAHPLHVEFIRETESKIERLALKLVEDHAVVDPINARLTPVAFIKKLATSLAHGGEADRANPERRLRTIEIDAGLLLIRLDLEQ